MNKITNKIVRRLDRAEGGITPEELERMKAHTELWIKRAFRTEKIEPNKIIPAIKELYKVSGLNEPRVIIVPSPLVMAVAGGFSAVLLANKKPTRAATNNATYDATNVATYDATYVATYDPTYDATNAATRAATNNATYDATNNATDDATDVATYAATYDATNAATRAATYVATDVATYDATNNATNNATNVATYDATYDPTYDATNAATRAATNNATYDATNNATDVATYVATYDATYDATYVATNVATYDATYVATRAATDDATNNATDVATYVATNVATRAATDDATNNATDVATYVATYVATNVATYDPTLPKGWAKEIAVSFASNNGKLTDYMLQEVAKWGNYYQGGNMWAPWECYITAARDILGLDLPIYEKYKSWEQCAIEGSFRFMHKDFCMVSDFPSVLKVDESNRPHCEDGPSHQWRDGWSVYHWHGFRLPDDKIFVITHPEKIIAELIDKEENAEVKRIMIERFGMDKYLSSGNAKLIDESIESATGNVRQLYQKEIQGPEETIKALFLKLIDATPQADGTRRQFIIPVHPECRPILHNDTLGEEQELTALNAVASTFGLYGHEYCPQIET